MRIKYESWDPGQDALGVIRQADALCREYAGQGYDDAYSEIAEQEAEHRRLLRTASERWDDVVGYLAS